MTKKHCKRGCGFWLLLLGIVLVLAGAVCSFLCPHPAVRVLSVVVSVVVGGSGLVRLYILCVLRESRKQKEKDGLVKPVGELDSPWELEMYRAAQKKIGEYDGYTFRCKQFLVPIIAAVIVAAYLKPNPRYPLLIAGLAAVVLLFLVEMTVRTVLQRLIRYSNALEESSLSLSGKARGSGKELRFAHYLATNPAEAWKEFGKAIRSGFFRPGVIVPYLVAAAVVVVGVLLASQGGKGCANT